MTNQECNPQNKKQKSKQKNEKKKWNVKLNFIEIFPKEAAFKREQIAQVLYTLIKK